MSRIRVIGDSHIHAIKRALAREAQRGLSAEPEVQAFRIIRNKNGVAIGDEPFEALLAKLAALEPGDLAVSVIGGNQHSVFGLVQHPQAFDFHSRERPDLPVLPRHEVIPYRVLRDQFEAALRAHEGVRIPRIVSETRARLVHLPPPAPKEDASHILRRHETDFAKAGILERGVTPITVRLKLWELQVSLLRELCAEWQAELMPVPPASLTPLGCLSPDYYAHDATHANEAYGALVLAQLRQHASSSPPIERSTDVHPSL
jgi:hypothetical protein